MKAKELFRVLKGRGCVMLRQKGSHTRWRCGRCFTTIPLHAGEELGPGLLRAIERDLDPCLGNGWRTA
jgi:predicted RNA binding protein YcfA (HicA-like mRNA interferase family)